MGADAATPFRVEDRPPDDADDRAMTPHELRAKLRLGTSAFYKYQSLGRFEKLELVPRIGPRRYSRKRVQQYLDREPLSSAPAALKRGVR